MDYLEIKQVLEKDLEQLLSNRSKAIEGGKEKYALELTRLIKDTISLINGLVEEENEEFDFKDYNKSVDLWLKENLDSHLNTHMFDDSIQRLAYKTGFENAFDLSKVILKSMSND